MSRCCPSCGGTDTKKNGHIHNGKQNHHCKTCRRQFVENRGQIIISVHKKERLEKLLKERIPLRGICRVEGVSLRWLLSLMVESWATDDGKTVMASWSGPQAPFHLPRHLGTLHGTLVFED